MPDSAGLVYTCQICTHRHTGANEQQHGGQTGQHHADHGPAHRGGPEARREEIAEDARHGRADAVRAAARAYPGGRVGAGDREVAAGRSAAEPDRRSRGEVHLITDEGQTIAETGAIIEYLLEKYGNGRLVPPVGTPERLRWRYWLHFAEGSAMPPLLLKLIFERIKVTPMPFFAKPIAKGISNKVLAAMVEPNLKRQLDFMEAELGKSEWFAGPEFSAADIQMSFPVEAAAQRAGLDASRPKLMAFLKRIHARPAYKKALERGGPYSFAND